MKENNTYKTRKREKPKKLVRTGKVCGKDRENRNSHAFGKRCRKRANIFTSFHFVKNKQCYKENCNLGTKM